jgi:LuxR family maltose regulon positive regulatory protein
MQKIDAMLSCRHETWVFISMPSILLKSLQPASPRRAKLRTPRLPGDIVVRPRLLARLNRKAALTLVIAPPGYGKTTLVASWLAQLDLRTAWLSLDEEDDEPLSFLAALIGAMATIFPDFGAELLATLSSPNSGPLTDLAVRLVNELNDVAHDFVLVLDDYHCIREPAIHQLLLDLVVYPPQAMHLVVITRHDPPLPWRIRMRGDLCELRAADLGFTEAEATQFLVKATARAIDIGAARTLVEQTQGWVTSLRLAALALGRAGEGASWSDVTSSDFRSISGYFSEEVFSGFEPDTLAFLLRTSILEILSGPLCDCVAGVDAGSAVPGKHGGALLRHFERAGVFTAAMDDEGEWYRYHPLFREVLRRRLAQAASADDIAELYARAAAWHEERGLLDEALAYALGTGRMEYAIAFIRRHRHPLLNNFEWRRLERWVEQFPAATIAAHVELSLAKAWTDFLRYKMPEIGSELKHLNMLLAELPADADGGRTWRAEAMTLRSQQCVINGDAAGAVEAAQSALADLPPELFYVRSSTMSFLAVACQMAGRQQQAFDYIDSFMAEPWVPRDLALARSLQLRGHVAVAAADVADLEALSPKLLQLVSARGMKTTMCWAHYFWATACYLQNNLQGAAQHFAAVLELMDYAHASTYTYSAIGLALTYQAQGRAEEATAVLDGARLCLAAQQQFFVRGAADAAAAELAARQGRTEEAQRWIAREGRQFVDDAFPAHYTPGLAFVWILLTAGTEECLREAQSRLTQQMEFAVRTHRTPTQVEALALEAALHEMEGNRVQARAALARALMLAESRGVVRIFVDLAQRLLPLFGELTLEGPAASFARHIRNIVAISAESQARVAAGPAPAHGADADTARAESHVPPPPPAEPPDRRNLRTLLTYREMDVLRLLEQRFTNKEIAHALGITTETVRQHTVNLFRKLGVENRRQAVAAAQRLHFFDGGA